jgi:hypothetical protein
VNRSGLAAWVAAALEWACWASWRSWQAQRHHPASDSGPASVIRTRTTRGALSSAESHEDECDHRASDLVRYVIV